MRFMLARLIVCFFYLLRIFPIKKNKIVISNFLGQGYKEEGAFILKGLLDRKANLDIVWLANDVAGKYPSGIRVIRNISIRAFYELATAKVWIDNSRKRYYIRKRKGQFYIQLWHGEICIKHVEKDAESTLNPFYVEGAKRDSKMADLMVACSEWRFNNMRNSFWYDGKILKGSLYLDYRTEEEKEVVKNAIYDKLGLSKKDNVILYAPTFRKDHRLTCYNLDFEKIIHACEKKFGGSWKVVVRLHPELTELQKNIKYTDNVKNGTMYPVFDDLLLITDILISDYSGVIFNGLKAGKKVFIFATDYEKYLREDRGTYFDFRKMPMPFTMSNDELIEAIKEFNYQQYEKKREAFVYTIGYYKNDAVEEVVEIILRKVNNV